MSARAFAAACAAILVASCASQGLAPVPASPASAGIALRNPGFEEATRSGENCPVGWNCMMHNDPNSFRFFREDGAGPSGARGYCIESVGREPWARMTQALGMEKVTPLRGAHLRLSLALKLDAVTKGAAGPLMIAQGGSGQVLRNAANLQPVTAGWHRYETQMEVPEGTFLLELGVLFQGKGKICVDDVRLEKTADPAGAV